jgi:hypothetical protein
VRPRGAPEAETVRRAGLRTRPREGRVPPHHSATRPLGAPTAPWVSGGRSGILHGGPNIAPCEPQRRIAAAHVAALST